MWFTIVLGLTALGQPLLPGSVLSLEQATQEAHTIVVARVGDVGDILRTPEISIQIWTELKPSAMLKGDMSAEELNRLPLWIRAEGKQQLPRTGEEFLFFIGNDQSRGAIAKILPNTAENVAAIRAARPHPAGRPLGLLGGLPAVVPETPPGYRGTMIHPDRAAEGDALRAQREFAAVMSRNDPKPEDRQAHFAWLYRNETFRRYGVSQVGWLGSIRKAHPLSTGGWCYTVTFRPWLYGGRGHTLVYDSVEETYEFEAGGLRLVASDAGTERPKLQRFPVAY